MRLSEVLLRIPLLLKEGWLRANVLSARRRGGQSLRIAASLKFLTTPSAPKMR